MDSLSDTTSEWSNNGEANRIDERDSRDDEKRIVLHPTSSTYATRYPDFDTFAGLPLINNGYVDDISNQCQEMIIHPDARFKSNLTPLDYSNTLFTAYTTTHREDRGE